ncbi:hypothetical protein [Kitasatospora albolonga]|uniref:hypothetical protein n=1 Tax=Kitasatospora albolonga TaxID=68173 RepID=UPI0035E6641C
MRFVLEVDLTDPAVLSDAHAELGRILRYWAGNLHHYPLEPGVQETLTDSTHRPVGTWSYTLT